MTFIFSSLAWPARCAGCLWAGGVRPALAQPELLDGTCMLARAGRDGVLRVGSAAAAEEWIAACIVKI